VLLARGGRAVVAPVLIVPGHADDAVTVALGYGQQDIRFTGAAIEARLYAEDPSAGFLPATGTLIAFEPAPAPQVRW